MISSVSSRVSFSGNQTRLNNQAQTKISFRAQPQEDQFAASSLTAEQQEKYLAAKALHTKKGQSDSFFTKVFKHAIPDKDPVLTVTRDGKINAGVILDGYPVNRGHALIVPKRQIPSIFDTTPQERKDLFTAMVEYKQLLEKTLKEKGLPIPQGYNIGINDGFTAGQTVPHLHVQFIPRYFGDIPTPHGGVRGVKGPEEDVKYDGVEWGKQKYTGPPDETVDDLFSKKTLDIKV